MLFFILKFLSQTLLIMAAKRGRQLETVETAKLPGKLILILRTISVTRPFSLVSFGLPLAMPPLVLFQLLLSRYLFFPLLDSFNIDLSLVMAFSCAESPSVYTFHPPKILPSPSEIDQYFSENLDLLSHFAKSKIESE